MFKWSATSCSGDPTRLSVIPNVQVIQTACPSDSGAAHSAPKMEAHRYQKYIMLTKNTWKLKSSAPKYTTKCLLVTWHRLQRPSPLNPFYKVAFTLLKKTKSMLVGSLYTRSRAEKYKVAWPGYTPEKKNKIDVVNDFDIDICLAVGFIRFRCFLGSPSMRSMIFPHNSNVARQLYTQSCRCFHRRDEKHHRYYNDRCLLANPCYSTTVRHKHYCLDVAHLNL